MGYKNVTISSGHGLKVRGASGYLDEVNEARKVVDKVAEYLKQLGVTVNVFHDNTSTTQSTNLQTIVNFHNKTTRDLDISIHFNANKTTSSPMGTEVLHYNAAGLASSISKAIAKAGGFKDRGGKQRKDLYFLKKTTKTAILIEVCFVDSSADRDLYKKNFEAICKAIAEQISGKVLSIPQPPKTSPQANTGASDGVFYRVITGSFENKELAEKRMTELKKAGFDSFLLPYKK
ncbi:N-acetylmuramoyl-L-alanine amidase [Neobacillus sedimentimangrovi]|uniref:N-acetylmuramoyl-L-alanine amidase n=1 Tax=Neobacillus sedimentimangrovi TaxID=2699460 RepID=A0ABS8QKD4_9BACI|nr:N-acetylmuramoyl-L-alanine amidase [Neobacillus sedimentimangrovi]MCD4839756.1 N-acetylmuramoyl-L-alanine amidase [Neobacillus sedimentimangrovi]